MESDECSDQNVGLGAFSSLAMFLLRMRESVVLLKLGLCSVSLTHGAVCWTAV